MVMGKTFKECAGEGKKLDVDMSVVAQEITRVNGETAEIREGLRELPEVKSRPITEEDDLVYLSGEVRGIDTSNFKVGEVVRCIK
jgi:hypothetical protein